MSDSVKPSVPEPPPINEGKPVTPNVIKWINTLFSFQWNEAPKWVKDDESIVPLFSTDKTKEEGVKLIEARDKYGFNKYKQHLMTGDGRNTVEDARQELGDFIQYWFKAKMNKENTDDLMVIFPILQEIIKYETIKYNKKIGRCYKIVATPEKVILGGKGPESKFFGSFSTIEEALFNFNFLKLKVNDVVWRYRVYEFKMDVKLGEDFDLGIPFDWVNDPDLKKFLLFQKRTKEEEEKEEKEEKKNKLKMLIP